MNHSRLYDLPWGWIVGAVLMLGPVAGSVQGDEPLPPGTLSGRIVGPDGKGVAGARITSQYVVPGPVRRFARIDARTDADGRFRTEPAEPFPDEASLTIEADGFARWSSDVDRDSIDPGQDHDLGLIQLDRGQVVTGQVIDLDGKPRPDTAVEIRVYRHGRGHSVAEIGPSPRVVTDDEGRFRSPPLPVGQLSLAVRVPERLTAHASKPLGPAGEQDLGVIRLVGDVPFTATVIDDEGRPVELANAGGTIGLNAKTNSEGKFTYRGLGPNPTFQLRVTKQGYVEVNGMVTGSDEGFRYRLSRTTAAPEPVKDLVVVLRRAGSIDGLAVDAETGKPVRLSRVVLSIVERRPDGAVATLKPDYSSRLEQPADGHFQMTYATLDEYHLTFQTEGYHDAEVFLPRVTELKPIGGLAVRMQPKTAGSVPTVATQILTGTVTRGGQPVRSGWVGLWTMSKPMNAPNAPVLRGRTVTEPLIRQASAAIVEGDYTLTAPAAGAEFYVTADEAGQPPTQVGPIALAPNETKSLDIACTPGGQLRGQVKNVPAGWEGNVWVVAFGKTGLRAEARAMPTGEFALPPLPPGHYGLKVGHDAYEDAEVYPGLLARQHPESSKILADPWKRAQVVTIEAGREVTGVEVDWPDGQ